MKIIQTTLTRSSSGRILVHGSAEDKDMDCIVAHTITPTFMMVRRIAEAGDALIDAGKSLAAIRDAFQNPAIYQSEGPDNGILVKVAVADGAPESSPSLVTTLRAEPRITTPELPEGFGRILSPQECADGQFPEYRVLLERARAALEEDGRMRGECPLLDDIYAVLEK